jgi:hypothetical protein
MQGRLRKRGRRRKRTLSFPATSSGRLREASAGVQRRSPISDFVRLAKLPEHRRSFICGDVVEFSPGQVEAVVSDNLYEHTAASDTAASDTAAHLASIRRALRPGGPLTHPRHVPHIIDDGRMRTFPIAAARPPARRGSMLALGFPPSLCVGRGHRSPHVGSPGDRRCERLTDFEISAPVAARSCQLSDAGWSAHMIFGAAAAPVSAWESFYASCA